ncbi:Flagellar biosynthesis protein FlgJ [uncultured Gammaproteobacteria bacterium]
MSIPNAMDVAALTKRGPAPVVAAVRAASVETGVDFSYLMEKAAVESSFQTDSKASTSSATGLYQFLDGTWLATMKEHGADHGLGRYADAIQRRPDGRMFVADPELRREILDLRKDAKTSALMAAELTRDNKDYMEEKIGGQIGSTELYMAHFLGAGGASKFIKAMRENPNQVARDLFPDAAASNRGVFYAQGKPTTLAQIYNRFSAKFQGATGKIVSDQDDDEVAIKISAQVASQPSTPRTTVSSSPFGGTQISMYTMLALAALETPDEASTTGEREAETPFASHRAGHRSPHTSFSNEFQKAWSGRGGKSASMAAA